MRTLNEDEVFVPSNEAKKPKKIIFYNKSEF